ncbi:hypothetical protein ISO77_19145, partial [Morganella morganii subsp. morganii]|uniref:hypothetical protein n=1 Tax=Morganella morganii TaxID=582 RepID=UPI001BDAA1E1
MLEDIGIDGQYVGDHETPMNRLVRGFCWHSSDGAVARNISAIRCHFRDMPHEAWEGYTTNGGRIDGISMQFCSADVTDPKRSAVGFNVFKTMNGIIDDPGSYGEYTIKNIVSTHNTATGMRSLNDFKRGS